MTDKRRAAVSGGELSYVDIGEGPAAILLHGFPLSSHMWRDFMPVLSSKFRLIVPDLLGAGDSDKPVDAPLHIRAQATYVQELATQLGIERFATIGHGIGGGIAQLLALEGIVDAMVLLDSVAFGMWPAEQTRDIQNATPEQEDPQLLRAVMHAAFQLAMGYPARLAEATFEEYMRPWEEDGGMAAYFRWVRSIDGLGLEDIAPRLAEIDFPVLILWGEADAFQPLAAAEALNDTIPTSTLGLLPGCGHFLTEDAPETLAPMVYEYLRARYLKQPHGHGGEGVVTIQLERKPPWVDLAEYEKDDWFQEEEDE